MSPNLTPDFETWAKRHGMEGNGADDSTNQDLSEMVRQLKNYIQLVEKEREICIAAVVSLTNRLPDTPDPATSRPTTDTRLDKAEFDKDDPDTLVARLRGVYDAPGVPGQYKTAPIQHEAARRIEELEAQLGKLK